MRDITHRDLIGPGRFWVPEGYPSGIWRGYRRRQLGGYLGQRMVIAGYVGEVEEVYKLVDEKEIGDDVTSKSSDLEASFARRLLRYRLFYKAKLQDTYLIY